MEIIKFVQKELQSQTQVAQQYQNILKERANLELQYAQSLDKLSLKTSQLCAQQESTQDLQSILYKLASSIKIQAEQANEYSKNLFENYQEIKQVFQGIYPGLQKQEEHIKYLKQQFQLTGKELEKRKMKYYNCMVSRTIPKDDLGKVEYKLQNAISSYNSLCTKANKNLPIMKKDNQAFEKIRTNGIKDSVMKYMVSLVSNIKNIEYDSCNLLKKIQQTEEVNEFVVSKKLDDFCDQIFEIDYELLKKYLVQEYKPKQDNFYDQNKDEEEDILKELDLNTVFKKVTQFFIGGAEAQNTKNANIRMQQSFNQQGLATQLHRQKINSNNQVVFNKTSSKNKIFDKIIPATKQVSMPLSSQILNRNEKIIGNVNQQENNFNAQNLGVIQENPLVSSGSTKNGDNNKSSENSELQESVVEINVSEEQRKANGQQPFFIDDKNKE